MTLLGVTVYSNLRFVNELDGIVLYDKAGVVLYIDDKNSELYKSAIDGEFGPIAPYEPPPPPTDEQLSTEARTKRNQFLADSDWTQLPDARNAMGGDKAAEWDTYRQALRDITAQAGFPSEIEWPTKPE